MNIKINADSHFAPLPIGKIKITKSYESGGSMILGSNYCWHESAGWKTRTWRYLIEEEDYSDLLALLHQIGGEMEMEMVEMKTFTSTSTSINLPDPADLDEL